MPRHRKNKSKWIGPITGPQPWFARNVHRQRNRDKIAKLSRRKNRRK
jgi:hypothetical protein